jgi:hypothetical protein
MNVNEQNNNEPPQLLKKLMPAHRKMTVPCSELSAVEQEHGEKK